MPDWGKGDIPQRGFRGIPRWRRRLGVLGPQTQDHRIVHRHRRPPGARRYLAPAGRSVRGCQRHRLPSLPRPRAYFGSRVEPRAGESQSDAVLRVESQIGRKFAIDHYYYQWTSSFPNSAQTWTVSQGRIPFINWKAGGAWSAIANGSPGRHDHRPSRRDQELRLPDVPHASTMSPRTTSTTYGHAERVRRGVPSHRDVFRCPRRHERRVRVDDDGLDASTRDRDATPSPTTRATPTSTSSAADGYNWYPGRDRFQVDSFEAIFTDYQRSSPSRTASRGWSSSTGSRRIRPVPAARPQWFARRARHRQVMARAEGLDLLRHDEGLPRGTRTAPLRRWPRTRSSGEGSVHEPGVHASRRTRRRLLHPRPAPPVPAPSPSPTFARRRADTEALLIAVTIDRRRRHSPSPFAVAVATVAVAGAVAVPSPVAVAIPSPSPSPPSPRRYARQHPQRGRPRRHALPTDTGGGNGMAFDTVVTNGGAPTRL